MAEVVFRIKKLVAAPSRFNSQVVWGVMRHERFCNSDQITQCPLTIDFDVSFDMEFSWAAIIDPF